MTDLNKRAKDLVKKVKDTTETDTYKAIWQALYEMKYNSRIEVLNEIFEKYELKLKNQQ